MKNGPGKGGSDIPLADRIFRHLLDSIYNGSLQPGSLINEVAIAQEFSVSRGPVREAVRRLQGIQLVTREPYLRARVATLSAESALELFQMRMVLEGLACRLAAQRMSDEAIAQLLVELENDRQAYMQSNGGTAHAPRVFDFHERIVRASGNNRIIDTLCGDLYHLLRLYRRRSGAVPERKDTAYAEHWQIMRALKARDGDLAESLMRSHIERAAAHLFQNLPSGAGQSDRYA
ncbi:MAG: GntR family transcriptional regulator [Burkholderiaceae bacterium]